MTKPDILEFVDRQTGEVVLVGDRRPVPTPDEHVMPHNFREWQRYVAVKPGTDILDPTVDEGVFLSHGLKRILLHPSHPDASALRAQRTTT